MLGPGEGGINPGEESSGKASWRWRCFNQALKSGEDVSQMRLTDGIVDGGAACNKRWRCAWCVVWDELVDDIFREVGGGYLDCQGP